MTQEELRLKAAYERTAHWRRWGPYLTERQWGTVREDYTAHGNAWLAVTHDQARSQAYRWGEDGLAGICDNHQRLCFALALWNGQDPILKERLFGLVSHEGNHGEDVKEYYFYLDSTPTHSYMRHLYKYPHTAFPYRQLVENNGQRDRRAPEYELLDTGVFDDERYFDIFVEYAKAAPEDILIRITVCNRGPETAALHLLPTLWCRNTWSWDNDSPRPQLRLGEPVDGALVVEAEHATLGRYWLFCTGMPERLFTDNETNRQRLYGLPNPTPYVKDSFHAYLIDGDHGAVNPAQVGTKMAAHYLLAIGAGESSVVCLRLRHARPRSAPFGRAFDELFRQRQDEAEEFYASVIPARVSADARNVMRQALAGMLWSKQFYHYDVKRWLTGDPPGPPPPAVRWQGRNHEWIHLYNEDIIAMPDKWEYPWYAAWDVAFHCLTLALVDPDFAKAQLVLFLREWYMDPNGQLPAYEWNFSDVNPPVHAWAAWRVYKIERRLRGKADRAFLERVFHKLLLNFTWWVNRKDPEGLNVFQGGFLGLDNIGVFDRSAPLPTGGNIRQSDATSWMAMYCLNMLAIALELARDNPAYEDVASKFFEHFVYIAHATHDVGQVGMGLWDEEDGFYYDVLHLPNGSYHRLKVRSLVGLIPLFAVETLEPEVIERLPGFMRRMQWFIDHSPEFREHVDTLPTARGKVRRLLALPQRQQLLRVLARLLDETEFLSPYGIRSLSQYHRDHPYIFWVNGTAHCVDYEPAESSTALFGGNSNWRGPLWFPVNYLLIESLQKFHYFYGDSLKITFPTGSTNILNLWEVAAELSRRLIRLFQRGTDGRRPAMGQNAIWQHHAHWRDLLLCYEYFHGDTGAGLGASHQTGWTGLVAKLIQQSGV